MMDNKLVRFLNKIELEERSQQEFLNATIESVIVNTKDESWTIHINLEKMIKVELFKKLCDLSSKLEEVKKVYFVFKHNDKNYLTDYCLHIFKHYQNICPMLNSIKESDIIIENTNIKIEVANNAELEKINTIKEKMIEFLNKMGYININITPELNNEKMNEAKELLKGEEIDIEEIKKNQREKEEIKTTPEDNKKFKFKKIEGKDIELKNIITDMNNVTVTVFIFGSEIKELSSGLTIATYKISDYTDSLYAKIFIKEGGDTKIIKELKEGSWYKMKGYVKYDTYVSDFVLNIKEFEPFDRNTVKRTDEAPVKRVELHCHTTMSQMDGLIDPKKLLKKVESFGHRAIGITDKNGIQCFPKVYKAKGDIQVLFGVELYAVNDEILIINKESDLPLMESEYVVFDTETTGFNAGSGDQMIEIGAVKIKKGEITDRFDELINPGRPLREEITNITNITDEMLKDKDTEENVTKRFKDWVGDAPMVAQNARFDISFMESAYAKYNLGTFDNVVIDTMEISKAQNPDSSKHNLTALVKRYGVPWDENAHHRADYDAEGTALVFHKMISSLGSSYKTISDLKNMVDPDISHNSIR